MLLDHADFSLNRPPLSQSYVFQLYFLLICPHPLSDPSPSFPRQATVGYGDITSTTGGEMLFNIFVILLGDVLYASLIGSVSISMATANTFSSAYHRRMDALQRYLSYVFQSFVCVCFVSCPCCVCMPLFPALCRIWLGKLCHRDNTIRFLSLCIFCVLLLFCKIVYMCFAFTLCVFVSVVLLPRRRRRHPHSYRQVSRALCERIQDHHDFVFAMQQGMDEREIVEQLPTHMRRELRYSIANTQHSHAVVRCTEIIGPLTNEH